MILSIIFTDEMNNVELLINRAIVGSGKRNLVNSFSAVTRDVTAAEAVVCGNVGIDVISIQMLLLKTD